MKTLYITDLDGTLLQPDATLGDETIRIINDLIRQGMYFTAATARTAASVVKMLGHLEINVPCVLMTGVCIYDLKEKYYISVEKIGQDAVSQLIDIIHRSGLSGFMYSIKGDVLSTRYENTSSPNAVSFIEERVTKYGKCFNHVADFSEYTADTVYYSLSDTEDKLRGIFDELSAIKSLRTEFYRDIYNENYWYLEVCAAAASKSHAVKKLRDLYGFDKVICFGDNLNDLPMFEASDECYAVANARDEVKRRAASVIKSNTDNGVAEWLEKNFKR